MSEQTTRRPLWKRRTVISKTRNISVVLWPPFHGEHGVSPPSVYLSEGKNVGTSDHPVWKDTRIRLTLDKLPRIIQDLQVAYAKALEVEEESSTPTPATAPASTPVRPQAQLTLAGRIYQAVKEEGELPMVEEALVARFGAPYRAVSEAIHQLEDRKFIKITTRGSESFLCPV